MRLALAVVFGAVSILSSSAVMAQAVTREQHGQLITEGVPKVPPEMWARLLRYNGAKSALFEGFSEHGGIVMLTKSGETNQLFEVAAPLASARQLTSSQEPVADGDAGVRPGGSDDVYYLRDQGGSEFYQAFLIDRKSGQSSPFTEAGARVDRLIFDRTGRRAAWTVARAGQAERELVIGDPAVAADRKVVLKGPHIEAYAFSSDGRKLLYGFYTSSTAGTRYVLDLETGQSRQLNPSAKEISYGFGNGGEFSADGRTVFMLSDEDSDFVRLVRLDLASGRKTVLTRGVDWDVDDFDLSDDGRTLVYAVNENGSSRLYLMATETGRSVPVPNVPRGVIKRVKFDRDGDRIGFTLSSAAMPGDVWVWEIRSRKLTRWTESATGGVPAASFAAATGVTIRSFDGLKIPGFLYQPRTPGPHPVIIQIHGGPEEQSRDEFTDPRIQFWVNDLGIAVLSPNIRGSSGYGKTYLAMDDGFKREDALKDIGALLDWIATQPNLDAKRVLVHGGSYGGYMTLSALAGYSDRLAGGVSIVGSSNLVSFLEGTQDYRRDTRRAEYGDERDPRMRAFLTRIAPLTNVRHITKPLLVVQGANDPRVPRSESEQIVAAVRRNGGEAWYVLALDEGHGFAKRSNVLAWVGAETMFFQHVLGVK